MPRYATRHYTGTWLYRARWMTMWRQFDQFMGEVRKTTLDSASARMEDFYSVQLANLNINIVSPTKKEIDDAMDRLFGAWPRIRYKGICPACVPLMSYREWDVHLCRTGKHLGPYGEVQHYSRPSWLLAFMRSDRHSVHYVQTLRDAEFNCGVEEMRRVMKNAAVLCRIRHADMLREAEPTFVLPWEGANERDAVNAAVREVEFMRDEYGWLYRVPGGSEWQRAFIKQDAQPVFVEEPVADGEDDDFDDDETEEGVS